MTPIPLTSPSGVVYAYACSACHHVSGGASMLWRDRDATGPVEQLVESSLRGAERCCTCHTCGVPLVTATWGGDCEACRRWRGCARAWADVARAVREGITSAEAWEAWLQRQREEEDD